MKTPAKIFYKKKHIGNILNYSYETPSASGEVEFQDTDLLEKMISLTSLSDFYLEVETLGLSEEQEDIRIEHKMAELNLSDDDFQFDADGEWTIEIGWMRKKNIRAVRFEHINQKNWIDWRF